MENQVITYTDYKKYKEELDTELQKSAESFVRIGYLLKVARDTNILRDSGYANVNEFAQKEYGLDKTQVSRFVHINDKFSEDGYSVRLKVEYRGFGYAKLSIMLLLPDEINNLLSPTYSKAEIQAIKEEVDEEKKTSEIEIMLEPKNEVQQGMENNLTKVIHQLGKDNPELYVELFKAEKAGVSIHKVEEILAPAGEKMYSARIRGIGRMMLSVRESEDRVTLVNVRTGEVEEFDWGLMGQALVDNMNFEKSPEESWENVYGEEFPKKEEVAPVQQEKAAPRKESKVSKAKVEKPKEEKKVEKEEKPQEEPKEEMQQDEPAAEELKEPEPQVKGQTSIYNHPECLPEGMEKPELEEQVIPQKSENHQTMLDTVIEIQSFIVKKEYSRAKKKTQELLWYLDKEAADEKYNA